MSKQADILLIHKYLNGELDARAMHELERRALDDPFLADALEGYEHSGTDQQKHLFDLSARLQNRTQKVKRLFAWGAISAAASVVLVIGLGIWFFMRNNNPQRPPQVAQVIVPTTKKSSDTTLKQNKLAESDTSRSNNATNTVAKADIAKHYVHRSATDKTNDADAAPFNAPPPAAESSPAPVFKKFKDSTPVNEMAVVGSKTEQKDTIGTQPKNTATYAAVNSGNAKAATPKRKVVNPDTVLQAHVDGLSVEPSNITGVVTGRDDGMPITGAIVKINGSGFGAVTDANGRFALRNVPQSATLAVGYIGYKSKKVRVKRGDSLTISLEPTSNSLAEVVVTKQYNENNPGKITTPTPTKGWDTFDNYLKEHSQSPDGKTGKVKLSFAVNSDGSLGNFKVTKSLSATDDQKAIDLIKNGPAWSGGSDNKPHEVKVTVKFN